MVVVQVGPVSAGQLKLAARATTGVVPVIIIDLLNNPQSLSARCYDIGA